MGWMRDEARILKITGAVRAKISSGARVARLPVARLPGFGLPVACLLMATALFLGGITESAGQDKDSRGTPMGLRSLMPGDERADFMGAAKPGKTGAASSLLLMIDTSRGMAGRRLSMAKGTAILAINRALGGNAEIAVLAFSGDCIRPISKWIGFSIDRDRLLEFVSSLRARGKATLGNALREASSFLEKAKSPSSQSQTMLLFSRGHDNCVNIPVMEPELREKDPETRHDTMILGILSGRSEARRLKRIANTMGGLYLFARNRARMNVVFQEAMDSMDLLELLGQFRGGVHPDVRSQSAAGRRNSREDTLTRTCRRSETVPQSGRRYEKFCGTATMNGQRLPAIYICGASEQWVQSNIYDLPDGFRECGEEAEQSDAGQENSMQRVFNTWE